MAAVLSACTSPDAGKTHGPAMTDTATTNVNHRTGYLVVHKKPRECSQKYTTIFASNVTKYQLI